MHVFDIGLQFYTSSKKDNIFSEKHNLVKEKVCNQKSNFWSFIKSVLVFKDTAFRLSKHLCNENERGQMTNLDKVATSHNFSGFW